MVFAYKKKPQDNRSFKSTFYSQEIFKLLKIEAQADRPASQFSRMLLDLAAKENRTNKPRY